MKQKMSEINIMNEINEWLITEVRKLLLEFKVENIQMINWFPRAPFDIYTCAIRLKKNLNYRQDKVGNIKVVCIGNYLNVSIRDEVLVNQIVKRVRENTRFGITPIIEHSIIVEHTSLTPVYPINMATFRSSVLGNALIHYCKAHGAIVHTHYLVSDMARNVRLATDYLNKNSLFLRGKVDHICAWIYCMALNQIDKFEKIDKLKFMFPKCLDNNESIELPDFIYTAQDYCNKCITGHIDTLKKAGIFIDILDYESVSISNFMNCSVDLALLPDNGNNSYLLSNVAYYSQLSSQADISYSVVSIRQRNVINKSISLLNSTNITNIVPIYFNDVASNLSHEDIDVIKDGVFHSIDGYIDEICKKFNISIDEGYSALKLMFLSIKPSEKIVIDYNSYNDIEKFIHFLHRIKFAEKIITTDNEIMPIDVLLVKKVIISYDVYSCGNRNKIRKSKDFSCHKIVNYIISLTEQIFDSEVNARVNRDVFECVLLVINNGLRILGIIND